MVEVDIGRIKKKLEKVRSLGERRLVLEWVREYLQDLRERRSQLYTELRGYLYALHVTVPLTFVSLLVSIIVSIHAVEILQIAVKCLVEAMAMIAISLMYLVLTRSLRVRIVEQEIRKIYDVVLDPPMRSRDYLDYIIVACILGALAILAAILVWVL